MKDLILNKILPRVQKPGRYIGMEINSIVKDPSKMSVKTLLAFPDLYEIGMSHFGFKILYDLINKVENFSAERTYAPWPDMEEMLRKNKLPLYSLENFLPASSFDIIGFSLQYELCYTNVLNMLDMSGIPVCAKDRTDGKWPMVIAGGPCAFNPEPMADFIDAFFIGEAEESLLEFLHLYDSRKKSSSKKEILAEAAAKIRGIYVPSVSKTVKKAVVEDLNKFPSPIKQLVPLINIVHDRAVIEIMRGCPNACRFCQAGYIYRPRRNRDKETILKEAQAIIEATGYHEISLLSLSTGDYPDISELVDGLVEKFRKRKVSISIPSLRVDTFSIDIAKKIQEIKKTGFTFACEAGTERMLDVIRKEIHFDDLYRAAESAYKSGWKMIKLYFMIGLPGERYEDLDKIVEVIRKVSDTKKAVDGRPGNVNVTISSFMPKAHTPLQWSRVNTIEEIIEKQKYIKRQINSGRYSVKFHEVDKNIIEAIFSRGGRELSAVVLGAWRKGAKFDDWREYFNFGLWMDVLKESGINPDKYLREFAIDESLPWDFIDTGVKKEALAAEYKKALEVANV